MMACAHPGLPHESQKLPVILGLIGRIYCVLLTNPSDYLMRGIRSELSTNGLIYSVGFLIRCCCGNEQLEVAVDIQQSHLISLYTVQDARKIH